MATSKTRTGLSSADAVGGKVITDLGGHDVAHSVAVQADGKIVVAGNSGTDFAVVRYNRDGSVDGGFGGITDMGSADDNAQSVALQKDGKIVVAGYSGWVPQNFALARYNVDGSLDTGFDGDGKAITEFDRNSSHIDGIALQKDGKIVAAGHSSTRLAVARYGTDGSLDTSFGAGGTVLTSVGSNSSSGHDVLVQPDGKILVAGHSNASQYFADHRFALVRYNADGSLDTSLSGDGMVTTDFGYSADGYSLALQTDGKIVVAGQSGRDFAVARYYANGILDASFGTGGKVTTDFGGGDDEGRDVIVQKDGKIVVAGYTDDGAEYHFALARYNPDGSLDAGFDGDGKLTSDFGGSDAAYSLALQADGKIVVAGSRWETGSSQTYDFALARYNPDGSLDTTFGIPAPPNQAPTGNPTVKLPAGKEDTVYTLKASDLLKGYTDPDGDTLSVVKLKTNHGTLKANANSTWTFTPAANYSGKVDVDYQVSDGQGHSIAATNSFTLAAATPTQPAVLINLHTGSHAYTVEGGGVAQYDVKLNTAITRDVTITFSSSDTTEGIVSTPKLLFTAANWNKAQTLEIRGVQDYLNDGDAVYNVAGKIETRDIHYITAVTPDPIALVNKGDRDALSGLDRDVPQTIYGDKAASSRDVLVGLDGADKIYGLNREDDLSGGLGKDTLYGGYGNDNLSGQAGNDTLYGEQDDDQLEGGAGNDSLDGGLGKDILIGGPGNDTYYLGYDAVDNIDDQGLPADVDTVIMPYVLKNYSLPASIEAGLITADKAANLTGNAGNNLLDGNDYANVLDGGKAGNDTLKGEGGNDTLKGGTGADVENGGAGKDTLVGGTGKDSLTGGSGADRFSFAAADSSKTAPDKITDFSHAQGDKIDLATAYSGTFQFLGKGAFTEKAGQLHYAVTGGNAAVEGDVNGDGTVDFAIQLTGVAKLAAGDFVL